MDQQLSARIQEVQALELRAVAAEEGAEALNTQLEAGRQRVAELDQQLSASIQEVQDLPCDFGRSAISQRSVACM